MKLLLASRFPPSLGGVETMGVLIAQEWAKDPSIELKVITDVAGPEMAENGFEVFRTPSIPTLDRLYRWADAVFFNHCYLKLSVPLLWQHKPYALSMSGTLETVQARGGAQKARNFFLRRLLARATVNIAACSYVQKGNKVPAVIIPNPYDAGIYHSAVSGDRPWDFFFGGRISQEAKGCFDLVDALAICRQRTGRSLTLTVAGDGPDLPAMQKRAAAAGLADCIRYTGILRGEALAHEMRQHRVIVVPSRYQEPIGIICLEGIACGCIAVGSSGGGLGESVGPCGFTFTNGDVTELAEAMIKAISLDQQSVQNMKQASSAHLAGYQPSYIARRYLEALRQSMIVSV